MASCFWTGFVRTTERECSASPDEAFFTGELESDIAAFNAWMAACASVPWEVRQCSGPPTPSIISGPLYSWGESGNNLTNSYRDVVYDGTLAYVLDRIDLILGGQIGVPFDAASLLAFFDPEFVSVVPAYGANSVEIATGATIDWVSGNSSPEIPAVDQRVTIEVWQGTPGTHLKGAITNQPVFPTLPAETGFLAQSAPVPPATLTNISGFTPCGGLVSSITGIEGISLETGDTLRFRFFTTYQLNPDNPDMVYAQIAINLYGTPE